MQGQRNREREWAEAAKLQAELAPWAEEPVCVCGGLKKGTEGLVPLVPSAAGARLAFTPQCRWAGGCPALGLGWPLISLLALFATFPGGLSLSPGVMDQLRGQRGGTWQQKGEQGGEVIPCSLRAFSTASWGGGGVRTPPDLQNEVFIFPRGRSQ